MPVSTPGPDPFASFRVATGERPLTTNRAYRMTDPHRRRILREWRAATADAVLEHRLARRLIPRARVDFTAVYPGGNLPDPHALHPTEKAILDEIVWHAALVDDTDNHVTLRPRPAIINRQAPHPLIVVEIYQASPVPGHPIPCRCRDAYERSQRYNQLQARR